MEVRGVYALEKRMRGVAKGLHIAKHRLQGAQRARECSQALFVLLTRTGRIVGVPSGELYFYAIGTGMYSELACERAGQAGC